MHRTMYTMKEKLAHLDKAKAAMKPSVPVKKSTLSTGIAERGLQGLISRKPVPCTLSAKSTEIGLNFLFSRIISILITITKL
ncbi:hypothetical protein SAMN06298221_1139 [Sphaerochaeta associata]|nr:hypothetical protein SAMN06298221_1139 [Sphaerochaeta associata]